MEQEGELMVCEYRPCICLIGRNEEKALFHKWTTVAIVKDAIMRGTTGGQIQNDYALVELENGTIQRVEPDRIVFIDDKVTQYFRENSTTVDFEKE